MKAAGAKAGKLKKLRGCPGKGTVFIGARRSGDRVTASREIMKRSATKQFIIIESITKLPKETATEKLSGGIQNGNHNWLRNPDLGNRLTNAFGKAVTAAKKSSGKLLK